MKKGKSLAGACALIVGFAGMARADIHTIDSNPSGRPVDGSANFAFAGPSMGEFTFGSRNDAGSLFGVFTDGGDGRRSGATGHFGGPIDINVPPPILTGRDFITNSAGYWAFADDLDPMGPKERGAKNAVVGPSIPEASTWAMLGIGFAGLALAGYRARRPPISIV